MRNDLDGFRNPEQAHDTSMSTRSRVSGTARFSIGVLDRLVPDDLEDTIRENAAGPAKVSGDAGSVEQHKLTEQIEADRYLASKKAAKSKTRGLRFNKLVPPGAD